jgi:hypothetical protein
MKFDKVLLPLHGSCLAEAALPKAVELVRNNPDATGIGRRVGAAGYPEPTFLIRVEGTPVETSIGWPAAHEREATHV